MRSLIVENKNDSVFRRNDVICDALLTSMSFLASAAFVPLIRTMIGFFTSDRGKQVRGSKRESESVSQRVIESRMQK